MQYQYRNMFSKRTNWETSINRITKLLRELQNSKSQLIDMTESNPTRVDLNYNDTNLLDALGSPENLLYNPDPKGLIKTRKAICDYYRTKGVVLSVDDIIITSGSSEAYNYIFRLITEPGDEILVPTPSYPLLQHLADINDIKIKYYRLNYDGEWHINFEHLKNSVTDRTKMIVCINPNNPTGSFIKEDEYHKIIEFVKDKNFVILSDEVFWDYKLQDNLQSIHSFVNCADVPNFVLNGISKSLALPQMKLGWIIVNGPVSFKEQAISKLEIISDTFLSVSIPIQNALPFWFKKMEGVQQEINNRLKINYNFLIKQIKNGLPIQLYNVEGGWNVILRLPNILSDDEWVELFLKKSGVFVHPGYYFDLEVESCIVLSLLLDPKSFQEGIEKIISQIILQI